MKAAFSKETLIVTMKISPEIAEIIMAVIRSELNPRAFNGPKRAIRRTLLFENRQLTKPELTLSTIDQLIRSWGIEPIVNHQNRTIALYCNTLGLDEPTVIWDNLNEILLLKSVEQFIQERHVICVNL